jgi:sortase A
MPDKRYVDELSVEELERILAIKRRDARQAQMSRLKHSGRVIAATPVEVAPEPGPSEALQKRKSVPEFEDAIDAQDFKPKSNAGRIWRAFVDRSLLLMEVGAVIGLIVLGFALFNGLNILQEETAAAQAAAAAQLSASIPTIAPTPELTLANVVLPTGHIFQNNRPVFNFGEVPDAMLGVVANQIYLPANVSRAPVTDDTPLRLIVPPLNLDNPIVQGIDWNALQQGIGMLPNGSLPRNTNDNVVLAAHNDIYGELFRHLDTLQAGDELQVQTRSGVYTYRVRETLIVKPNDVHVMSSQGTPMLTLISCYPYQQNTERIVVHADRVDI